MSNTDAHSAAAASDSTDPTSSGTSSLPSRGGARLARFIVFNSSLGPNEGEDEKRIVFYHPREDDSKTRCTSLGFAEACTNFAGIFFPGEDCRCVQTRKAKTAFLQPEPGFWLSLTVNLPFVKKKSSKASANGSEYLEHLADEVHDGVLLSLLRHAYGMFSFFNGGGFSHLLRVETVGDVAAFKARVDSFFTRFVPTLRPAAQTGGLSERFMAIRFLPLEPKAFLRVQSFVNRVVDEFPFIEKTVFFQQGDLVWSELQQEDTRLLYYYITETLLPSQASSLSSSTATTPLADSTGRSPFSGHLGRFLAGGPPSTTSGHAHSSDWKRPRVHLHKSGGEYHLLVYHAVSSTVCFLVPVTRELTAEFFRTLDAVCGQQLTNISTDLLDVFGNNARVISSSTSSSTLSTSVVSSAASDPMASSVRFLYFNSYSLAMKKTLRLSGSEDGTNPELLKVVLDLSEDIDCAKHQPVELVAKTSGEQWVVAKASDRRQVYVIVTSKCASITEVAEEVNKLVSTEFKNVCLLQN